MAAPFESCGPTGQRILQIHPTLRCNLQCEHCYSRSGPWSREELDLDVVNNVVSDAARMGYGVLSVSGGEPFLYPGLSDVFRRAPAPGEPHERTTYRQTAFSWPRVTWSRCAAASTCSQSAWTVLRKSTIACGLPPRRLTAYAPVLSICAHPARTSASSTPSRARAGSIYCGLRTSPQKTAHVCCNSIRSSLPAGQNWV